MRRPHGGMRHQSDHQHEMMNQTQTCIKMAFWRWLLPAQD